MEIEYVTCPACERPMGLFATSGKLMPDNLTDPFDVECRDCEAKSTIQKSDIQSIDFEVAQN